MVSEELDELFELADRLVVLAGRRLSPPVGAHAISVDEIGRWMAGLWPQPGAAGEVDPADVVAVGQRA